MFFEGHAFIFWSKWEAKAPASSEEIEFVLCVQQSRRGTPDGTPQETRREFPNNPTVTRRISPSLPIPDVAPRGRVVRPVKSKAASSLLFVCYFRKHTDVFRFPATVNGLEQESVLPRGRKRPDRSWRGRK